MTSTRLRARPGDAAPAFPEEGRVVTRAQANELLIGVLSPFSAANVTDGSGSPEPGALNDRGDYIIPPEWHQVYALAHLLHLHREGDRHLN